MASGEKDPGAFKTIGELSAELGVAQHILRYWESKFPQLRPLQRAGNRRYYRPADVALARQIHRLLSNEGYTVRGVQKLLREKPADAGPSGENEPAQIAASDPGEAPPRPAGIDMQRLIAVRDRLAETLSD